jgi:hypothetical protein
VRRLALNRMEDLVDREHLNCQLYSAATRTLSGSGNRGHSQSSAALSDP